MDPSNHSELELEARTTDTSNAPKARRGPAALAARLAAAFGGLRRHKKLCALLAVLLLGGAALAGRRAFAAGRPAGGPAADGQAGDFSFVRTVTLERTTLENTVSATGTIESVNVSTVTTPLTYTVRTVEVQVGTRYRRGM